MLLSNGGAFWFSEGNRAPCRLINELEEFRKKEKLARGRTFCVTKAGRLGKGRARDGAGTYRSWAANFRLERLVDRYSYLLLAIHNPSFLLLRRV